MGNNQIPNEGWGHRVINVSPDSPGKNAGLVEFIDFIVGVSETFIPNFQSEFAIHLEKNIEKKTQLIVYSIIERNIRYVNVVPNRNWANADSLLGIKVKWEKFLSAQDNIYRVTKVQPHSPAARGGLRDLEDFIIGSSQFDYENFDKFTFSINYAYNHMDNPKLDFCVYNLLSDSVRFITIYPARGWGGDGLLGCEFGTGYLNELTTVKTEKVKAKENKIEILDDDASQNLAASNFEAPNTNDLTLINKIHQHQNPHPHTVHLYKDPFENSTTNEEKGASLENEIQPERENVEKKVIQVHHFEGNLKYPQINNPMINEFLKNENKGNSELPKVTEQKIPEPEQTQLPVPQALQKESEIKQEKDDLELSIYSEKLCKNILITSKDLFNVKITVPELMKINAAN